MNILNVIPILGSLIVAATLIGCDKKTPTQPTPSVTQVIRIGAALRAASLPVFVAEEEGFFTAEGIKADVTDYINGRKCFDMLHAGSVDIATVGDVPIMFDAFKALNFAIIGTITTSKTDIKLITTSTTITLAKQLEGKRIGVTPRTVNQYFLDTYLLMNGVDPRNVTIVPLEPDEMLDALSTNKVDVVSTWEPIAHEISAKLGNKVKEIISPEAYTATFNLVVPRKMVGTADPIMVKVLRAIGRAQELIRTNPERAKRILANRLKISPRIVEQIWDDSTYRLSLNTEIVKTLENEARWALREGYVTAEQIPTYNDLIYTEPLRLALQ